MKLFTASALVLALATPVLAETYHFDQRHTEIRFYYNHAGLTEQSGEWTAVSGTVEFDPENVTATSADITIDASSVETGWGPLNDHLKSGDFFMVSSNSETFRSLMSLGRCRNLAMVLWRNCDHRRNVSLTH